MKKLNKYLCGKRILPKGIKAADSVTQIIDETMLAYNSGRLRAACILLKEKYSASNVTIGMSLAGALTPAGLGPSCIIPLMKHGYIDWLVATGANMYHDIHFAFNLPLHQGSARVDDADLRKHGVIRIYDIYGDYYGVLLETDVELRKILVQPQFQKEMGTQEFYYLLGRAMNQYEKKYQTGEVSILACAYRLGIPIFTSSPGDSTIGMNIAGLELLEHKNFKLKINPSIDVNESTAIVLDAKKSGGKSAVILVGGGSPKNFILQTEPQIQEILRIKEVGHDYDINITDARPDTGGLSGATPSEAVSWGKIDPNQVEENVVVYGDSTVYLPLMTSYVLASARKKKPKKLYHRRAELYEKLKQTFFKHNKEIPLLKRLLK
ncbi:MAG: deoxyhypusine synthase [Candidatus Latescibacteria bacterium]|nr:deoxyhypusine synthase [Candidatus Latescibacterota bacterium]